MPQIHRGFHPRHHNRPGGIEAREPPADLHLSGLTAAQPKGQADRQRDAGQRQAERQVDDGAGQRHLLQGHGSGEHDDRRAHEDRGQPLLGQLRLHHRGSQQVGQPQAQGEDDEADDDPGGEQHERRDYHRQRRPVHQCNGCLYAQQEDPDHHDQPDNLGGGPLRRRRFLGQTQLRENVVEANALQEVRHQVADQPPDNPGDHQHHEGRQDGRDRQQHLGQQGGQRGGQRGEPKRLERRHDHRDQHQDEHDHAEQAG